MMHKFRTMGESWVVKAFLLLLVASFGLWGIGDYVNGSSRGAALSIGETGFSLQDVAQEYENQQRQLAQAFGRRLTPEEALTFGLPTRVLSSLLQEGAMKNLATELNIAAAPSQIKHTIENTPDFQAQDGTFDVERYRQTLRTIGFSVESFEASQAEQLQIQSIAQLFVPPALPKHVLSKRATLAEQSADLAFIEVDISTIPVAPLPNTPETEKTLRAAYTQNQGAYATPETRDLATLTLNLEAFIKQVNVSEADIAAAYAARQSSFATPEQRRVRQILFPTQAAAAEALANIQANPTTFAASEPIDLGLVKQTDFPAEFGQAIFSLDVNTVSDVIQGPLGFHLVRVTEIIAGATPDLAEVKTSLTLALQLEHAQDALLDAVDEAEDLIAGGATVAEIGAALGLTPALQTAATANAGNAILAEAFALPTGQPSDVLETDTDTYNIVEVTAITPAQIPAFESVRPAVEAAHTLTRQVAKIQENRAAMATHTTANGLYKTPNLVSLGYVDVQQLQGLKRDGTLVTGERAPAWLTAADIQTIFNSPIKQGFGWVRPEQNRAYFARLANISTPTLTPEFLATYAEQNQNLGQGILLSQYLNAALSAGDIQHNLLQLRQIFGEEFQWSFDETYNLGP